MGGKLNAHPLKVSLEVNVILTRQYNLGKGMLHHLINILPRGITSYLFSLKQAFIPDRAIFPLNCIERPI